jgi:hypothetical protein
MSYLSIDEFKRIVLSTPLSTVVQEHIFQGMPYVFREKPEALNLLTRHLSTAMHLSEQSIVVVGSAKIGFSLNPDNFPRRFSDVSDIDVIVVNEDLFDRVWMTLLRWHYPRRLLKLGRAENEWVRDRRKDIYWGWLVPTQIRYEGLSFPGILKPLRDISAQWFNAFQGLSLHPEFATRSVSGRLYRTWDHALRYHEEGLRQIQNVIRGS